MIASPCPADAELQGFLEENPATEDVAAHINACPLCQRRLDELAARDTFAADVASRLRAGVSDATWIAAALKDMKSTGEEFSPEEITFPPGLISPSDYPGALGRFGQYELLQLLGRGGMGAVFKAYDPSLHRVVAIKMLAPHLAHNPLARKALSVKRKPRRPSRTITL